MNQTVPLRQRKREKLRLDLIRTARRMFCEKGYESTTLQDICNELDIHVRTLLRYFGTKEELALAPAREAHNRLKLALKERNKNQTVIDCFRDYVSRYWIDPLDTTDDSTAYLLMLRSSATLRGLSFDLNLDSAVVLSRALSRDAGIDHHTDIYSQMLASSLVDGARSVAMRHLDAGADMVIAYLLSVIDMVEASFPSREAMLRVWRAPSRPEGL